MKEAIEAFDSVAKSYDEYMEQTGHLEAQRKIVEKLGLDGSILDVGALHGKDIKVLSRITISGLGSRSGL
ncbi:hypothetical protein ES703_30143 [subsurface metagenome]